MKSQPGEQVDAPVSEQAASILTALQKTSDTDQVTDPLTDQVARLLPILVKGERSASTCMERLGLTHRPTFRANYLNPALSAGLIERTIPDKPNSRLQKYRLTGNGRAVLC